MDDLDKITRRAYFSVGGLVRAGFDFNGKVILVAQIDDDARRVADLLHPMAKITKAMRVLYACPVLMELKGRPELVKEATVWFEARMARDGYAVKPMPPGFVIGWP